jgi:apolipoprotein D and lipocalin family protein
MKLSFLRRLVYSAFLLPLIFALSACSTMNKPQLPPLATVPYVDLERFMGDWYVQGIIPWFVERNNVGTMDIYAMRPDGRIDISYVFHKKSLDAPRQTMRAVGTVFNKDTNAEWRVQFLWPFQAPFLVIYLDEEYQTTAIGHPDRNLLWIMSREPVLAQEKYDRILRAVAAQGYDVSRVERVPQRVPGS